MKVDDIIKMTLGDLIVKNAMLQAKIEELEREIELAKTADKVGEPQ